MRKLGVRTIEVMEYGTGKTKRVRRMVYSEKTLTYGVNLYWLKLYGNEWVNTTRQGIETGIVVSQRDYPKIR